jgi:hypothetical protein
MPRDELYLVICDQAYYAALRYDARRQDKIQELFAKAMKIT